MSDQFTEAELEMLSPEERAAITASEDGASDDDDDGNQGPSDEEKDTPSADDLDELADELPEADAAIQDAGVANPSVEIPDILSEPVENLAGQLAELSEQRTKLRQDLADEEARLQAQYESAELDDAAYRKALLDARTKSDIALEDVADKRASLKAQNDSYEREVRQRGNALVNAYKADLKAFLSETKAAGVDYEDPAKPRLTRAMDEEIKAVAEANPTFNNRQVLQTAHTNIVKEFGLQAKPIKQTVTRTHRVAPTLVKVPSGASDRAGKDVIDPNLSGIDLERQIAGMSEEAIFNMIETLK